MYLTKNLPHFTYIKISIISKLNLHSKKYVIAHKGIDDNIDDLIEENIKYYKGRATTLLNLICHPMTMEEILKVLVKEGRAIVDGINLVSKSAKPSAKYPQGGIIKQEASVHISNLNVVDAKTNKPTRIGRRKSSEGTLVRYSKKSGEEI